MQTRSAAIKLAKRGFRVFRLQVGKKKPIKGERFKECATCDPAEVYEMWTLENGEPAAYNIGIYAERFLIVDEDNKDGKDGAGALAAMGGAPRTMKVRTPNGGFHHYYDAAGERYGLHALAPGLDVRADGGYVVGPGSRIGGKCYEFADDTHIAPAPQHITAAARAAQSKEATAGSVAGELDTVLALHRASTFLEHRLPAVEEENGDAWTYKTCCAVLDFGLSEGAALELLLDWNERCEPPWEPEALEKKLQNAMAYRKGAIGRDNPGSGMGAIVFPEHLRPTKPAPAEEPVPFVPFDFGPEDAADLPPRRWVSFPEFAPGYVTLINGPGGASKSTLNIAQAIAVARGDGRFIGMDVRKQCNVLLVNKEDDMDEMRRRIRAACMHYKIEPKSLAGKIFIIRDTDAPFLVARREKHSLIVSPDVPKAIEFMRAHNIGLMFIDPLVETHEADENDNAQMAAVMAAYKLMARGADAAVSVAHHSSKPPGGDSSGHAGNMHAGRGASSVVYAARVSLTLMPMTVKEAQAYGREGEHHTFVRLDDAKANNSVASPRARWFERVSVDLPNGDSVGVLRPVQIETVAAKDIRVIGEEIAPHVPQEDGETLALKSAVEKLRGSPMFRGEPAERITDRIFAAFEEAETVSVGGRTLCFYKSKSGGAFYWKAV